MLVQTRYKQNEIRIPGIKHEACSILHFSWAQPSNSSTHLRDDGEYVMGMLLLKRDTGGYLECLGTATSTKLCWGYRSTAGGGSIVPHSPSLSQVSRIVCKNICKMFAEQKHFSGFPTDHIGGVWPGNGLGGAGLGRKQAISNNFHGWRRILGLDKKLPVKVGWWQFSTSLQVLSLSNTPGLLLPAQIREITHCYNFLWR